MTCCGKLAAMYPTGLSNGEHRLGPGLELAPLSAMDWIPLFNGLKSWRRVVLR